ncbi:MAG TPA: nucleotide sugar dehydrogenase [Chitinophagaceae bacterium]|nr:nucleotide sugar dehydrogenase [Chitinophagaceae bacterium]
MKKYTIGIIGLGYVGLPLAVEFARKYPVVGFDINNKRVNELMSGHDATLETCSKDLHAVLKKGCEDNNGLYVTSRPADLLAVNFYIITVPTPVDKHNHPDLTPLRKASAVVAKAIKKGDIVVYESTVYPGVTEDECVPILEADSGLVFNEDFFVGYSPERINPGDKEHSVTKIKKVTSGSTPAAAKIVNEIYSSVIIAGTHMAPSIKVAEAAKVIENAQRDINIAFINELAKIFNCLNIDTGEVLAAAATKWNFLQFKPGLVGGHCIGVDPYYLAQKAMEAGYHPEIILAGRRMNDGMGAYVAGEVIKIMIKKGIQVSGSRALIMGITFKENCPDVRNSKVIDIIKHLESYHVQVDVYDPWADIAQVLDEYGIHTSCELPTGNNYDAVVVTVAHRQFTCEMVKEISNGHAVLFDVKSILDKELVDARL